MIIGNDNKPVSEDIVNNCKLYIEENMPIGCQLTVTTPSLLNVVIKANVELKEGYDMENIKLDFEASLNEYLKGVTSELTYSKIYGLLVNHLAVEDIAELKINNSNSNISISEDKIINISEIILSEVV
jgi:hypothetical protein